MKLRPARALNGRLSTAAPGPRRPAPRAAWLAGLSLAWGAALAQTPPAPAAEAASAPAPVLNSSLDAPMFYELLLGEMATQVGLGADGFEVMLDAARRSRDGAVFQRAIEMAIQGRSGDRALAAVQAWRKTLPQSVEAVRTQVQLLVAVDKLDDLPEPLRELIERQPAEERAAVISGLPRFLGGVRDKAQALTVAEATLTPFLGAPATRTASQTALARLALAAGQRDRALALITQALQDQPSAPGPVLLALEMMGDTPAAEPLVRRYLERPDALNTLRLGYVQALEQRQRLGEAVVQLRQALAVQPDLPQAWLTLGAYLNDLQSPREAMAALDRFFALQPAAPAGGEAGSDEDDQAERARRSLDYGCVQQAEAHEQLGELQAAAAWLDRIPAQRLDLSLLVRRATLTARLGDTEAALAQVRDTAVRGEPDASLRRLAQAQVLRDIGRAEAAYQLLTEALAEQPDEPRLLYEQAMLAERLQRYEPMETLLRRVIVLKPDDAQAYNALGYSMAERNVRLDEARALIQRAVDLAPEDPFILDSLGWVAYRQGRLDEALDLLQKAYHARPHAEVATHLGEVLWMLGRHDEALARWREARQREKDNAALRETLQRLKVSL